MRFEPHRFLPQAYAALAGKFSFIVMRQDDGWHTSWQDQEKGGSASNTVEGPFTSRDQAETRCRAILKSLRQKN